MKLETWVYKQALELYPRAYRDQFGQAMLETYTDALKAAKLEGKTWGFHWNTFLDTVKSVARATAEVKNYNPMARVTAVLGLVLLVIIVWVQNFPSDLLVWRLFFTISILYCTGASFFANCLYEMRQKWIMPLMLIVSALFVFTHWCVAMFYPSQYANFYSPQMNPYANVPVLVLGYLAKVLSPLILVLFVGGIALDTIEKRKMLPLNRFSLSYVVLVYVLGAIGLQNQSVMFMFKILATGFGVVWFALMIFICFRLWQQPRASQLKLTKP